MDDLQQTLRAMEYRREGVVTIHCDGTAAQFWLNRAGEWELRHGHTLGRPETITGLLNSIREA